MYQHRRHATPPPSLAPAFHLAVAAAALLSIPPAQGQTSATVALTSEYSARGVSLSDGRPAAQLSLAYDSDQGWYTGVFASRVALAERANDTQLIAYGGYASRLPSGLSWEAGATRTAFLHVAEYDYSEVYVGLSSDRLSGRLYYAPAYYGYGGRTAYAEINGAYPLSGQVTLIGHLGALHALEARTYTRDRRDMRIALGANLGPYNIQLAWLGTDGHARNPSARAFALSVSRNF